MAYVSVQKRPPGSAVYGLRVLNHHFSQRFAGALAKHQLTLPQVGVMFDVARTPGVSSAGVARARHMTPQTLSEIITGLEREGLVERRPRRGRTLGLHLTAAGAARLAKAGSAAAGIEREMLAGLSAKDQERFRQLIFGCVTHLSSGKERARASGGRASGAWARHPAR
ncbi:MAG TPA: MarR family winged helix-turn-helix transcriptional regulator [Candidatus Limnocylindria bacterium]|nr:MarR family winged helix-turn-helix transcriptional regulator [Candidatus Limnocylindria bacterium]